MTDIIYPEYDDASINYIVTHADPSAFGELYNIDSRVEGVEEDGDLILILYSVPSVTVAGKRDVYLNYYKEMEPFCVLRLVGIELNPGPKAAGSSSTRKKAKNKNKTARRKQRVRINRRPANNMAGVVRKDQSAAASNSGGGGGGGSNSFLGNLGGTLGGAFFGDAGKSIGSTAGNFVSKIFGWGAYHVNKNTLMGNGDGIPSFGTIGDGHIITHREFLTDITGSTTFTLSEYDIQPGNFNTFPWLSALTVNYEQYELMGLIFEFKSTSAYSVSSTNTALGTVIMATNYDTYDSNFTSKQQMEAYEFSTSCPPYESMIHPVECAPRLNVLSNMYLRSGAAPSGADQRFYDMGKFQIATTGMQSGVTTIGELWVSYMIRLLKPKLPTPLGAGLQGTHLVEGATATASATNAFGSTGGVQRSGSLLNLLATKSTITLPNAGRYLISALWVAATGTISAVATLGGGSNTSSPSIINDNGSGSYAIFTAAACQLVVIIDVAANGTGTPNQVTWTGPTGMTTGACDLFVQQINSALTIPQITLEDRLLKLEEMFSCKSECKIEIPISPPSPDYVRLPSYASTSSSSRTPYNTPSSLTHR